MNQLIEIEGFKRYVHYDRELENVILGAILLEKNCLTNIAGMLNENLFYYNENKFVFKTINWMWQKGLDIDFITVTHLIMTKGLEKWQSISKNSIAWYLSEISKNVVSTAHVETHCLLLRQMYINRLLFEAKYSKDFTMDAALETKEKINEAFNIGAVDSWLSIEEVINKKLNKRMNEPQGSSIIETSFRKINETSPIEVGDYIIIGARPSIGKTSFAMQLAKDVAIKGNSVGVISLETKGDKLSARMLAAAAEIEFWKIWKNRMAEQQEERFYKTALEVSKLPVFIFDKPTVSHVDIRIAANKIRQKTKGNLLLIIDYIQLVAPEEKTKLDKRMQISEISRTLKLICMELENTSIIALAQLTRDAAKEPPRMHHLKESGSLEQDADKVWLLHRNRDREEELKKEGVGVFDASLFIEKNKEGWTGEVALEFHAEQMVFKEKSNYLPIPTVAPINNYYETMKDEDMPF